MKQEEREVMTDPVMPSAGQPVQPSVSPVNPTTKPAGTMGTVGVAQAFPQTPLQTLPQKSPIMPPVKPIPLTQPIPMSRPTQPLAQPSAQPSVQSSAQQIQPTPRQAQQSVQSAPQLPAEQPSTLLSKKASEVNASTPVMPVQTKPTSVMPIQVMPTQVIPTQVMSRPVKPQEIKPQPIVGSIPVSRQSSPIAPTPIRVAPASAGGTVFTGISAPVKTGTPIVTQPLQSSPQSSINAPQQAQQSQLPHQSTVHSTIQPQPQKPQIAQTPKEQPGFKSATPSDVKQSPFRFLPLVLGVLLLIGGLWFVITRFFSGISAPKTTPKTTQNVPAPVKQTTLTYWGLWEASPILDQVIKDFQTQNAGVIINYVQQSPQEYRERLQDALQKGQSSTAPSGIQIGPDIFRYHATWVPMLKNQLSALPSSVMSASEFSQTFYPVAVKQLTTPNGIVGIPLMYDGLGLYYNKQMFQTANVLPPTQWSDLETTAKALTIRSKDKKISQAGVALGLTANVDNFSDILGLLILQNGGDPAHPSSKLVVDTVKYYTNFNRVLGVWDETLPNSTYAFATEKAAMMIAPSWRAFEVKAINPNVQFAIAPVPQLQGTNTTWASYWVEGVSKTSKQQELSWKFLKYMSSKEVLQKLYNDAASKTPRLFGEIYPRVDMASTLTTDPYVGAFVSDAPKASSWRMSSRTFDNGINDKIIKYYQDAINTVNAGQGTPEEIVKNTEIGVQQVLQQNP